MPGSGRSCKAPNPGSDEAVEAGCICAVIDNHYGRGVPQTDGTVAFWYTATCPVHRYPPEAEEGDGDG